MKDFADFSLEKINGKPARLRCVCDTRDVRGGHDLCRVHERPLLLRRERDLFAVSSDKRVVGCDDMGAALAVFREVYRGLPYQWTPAYNVDDDKVMSLVDEAIRHCRSAATAETIARSIALAFAGKLPKLHEDNYVGKVVKVGCAEDHTVIGGTIEEVSYGVYELTFVDVRHPDWKWRKSQGRHESDYIRTMPISMVRILVD